MLSQFCVNKNHVLYKLFAVALQLQCKPSTAADTRRSGSQNVLQIVVNLLAIRYYKTFESFGANMQLNLQLAMLCAARQVTTPTHTPHTHTHTHTHTHMYIPATALQLDTVIYKHVANLLHVSAFSIRLQGGSQQSKVQ